MATQANKKTAGDVLNLINKIDETKSKLMQDLENYYSDEGADFIPLQAHRDVKIGEYFFVDQERKVKAEAIYNDPNVIIYIVVVDKPSKDKKSVGIKKHYHDFTEDLKVMVGSMHEKVTGQKLEEGDQIRIMPFDKHELSFVTETIFITYIYK